MKNVRKEGADLVYDCEAKNCGTPGEPHRVPLDAVMASLETSYREFIYHGDPRAEALDVVLQYVYQQLYSDGATDSFPTDPLPWEKSVHKMVALLDEFYGVEGTLGAESNKKKEFLN